MQIIPVDTPLLAKQFIEVAGIIYANDANWIQPLNKDIDDVFDEKKNKAFRFGKVIRWILKNNEGQLIGRIAAFQNQKYKNKGDEIPVGGIGFFECINNQDAADLLLDNARHWLTKMGMEAMDGPINFGERDRWWGLVTEGYKSPLYGMNYNPPYYKTLFENYGFKVFYNQICLGMKNKEPLQNKIWEKHDLVALDTNFSAKHASKKDLEKYATDFSIVYNKAWAGHSGMKQIAKEQAILMFNKMKPVMDERLLWFAYYKSEPIAIFISIPDLNQWFKYLKGKFGLLQKLQFLWIKQFTPNKKFTGLVFGIVPEFQGKGIDSYIVGESAKVVQQKDVPYTDFEMQWIGDFNPKMLNIAQNLGEVFPSRTLATYRYIFDPTIPFKRHPIL
jgi:hypothetical protein